MLRSSSALPPIVPVLRSLMAALGFDPTSLPHLRSLSPSFLLDLLSVIIGQPLPLPLLSPRRASSALDDTIRGEVEMAKLIIGVLAMSTGLDMASLDPRRAVERHTAELLILARATVLVAVEHGWDGTRAVWQDKVLSRQSVRRRPARTADCASSAVSFSTPPPRDLPLPLTPLFSPIRHSTPPPEASQARPVAARKSSTPPHPATPRHNAFQAPVTPAKALTVPAIETDPITRLTAPELWQQRLEQERSALRVCLDSLQC